jgi:hypothetical protein
LFLLFALLSGWTSEKGDSTLTLSQDWTALNLRQSVKNSVKNSAKPMDGELLATEHQALGVVLYLRALPTPGPAAMERALLSPEELQALAPDRVARSIQRESPQTRTHFLGPSELGPHLARWVYESPDGRTLFWQVIWQTGGGDWYQIYASGPKEQAAPMSTLMRQVESGISVTTSTTPSLLAKKVKNTCPTDAHFSRGESIAGSKAFVQAKVLLAEHATTPEQAAIGELRLMGLLYRSTEACLRQTMEGHPVCAVYEAPAATPQDHLLLGAVRDCVDQDSTLQDSLQKVLIP